jgi:hypothetical protein
MAGIFPESTNKKLRNSCPHEPAALVREWMKRWFLKKGKGNCMEYLRIVIEGILGLAILAICVALFGVILGDRQFYLQNNFFGYIAAVVLMATIYRLYSAQKMQKSRERAEEKEWEQTARKKAENRRRKKKRK